MDTIKLLKSIKSLNDFITATQVITTNSSSLNIQLNSKTVLELKNIQAYEVEYFNKHNESGAAFKIFELILQVPPSNTWGVVGGQLVCIIQYWLEAVRKHLITHNIYWWTFLSTLLNSIQIIFSKHNSIVKCLVERTSDCLLDLATRKEPHAEQRYTILQAFNQYCERANRQSRMVMKHKFDKYLVLLSAIMAMCGDVRIQYSIMETLIRWLLPRQELKVREAAAASWFPTELYTQKTIKVFLERPWQHFSRDTRNFLNAHNEKNESVVSIICRKLTFGTVEILSGPREYWLDLNCGTKCLSVIMEPSLYKPLGITSKHSPRCDALVIKEENTTAVELNREPRQIYISLKVVDPLQIFPSKVLEKNHDIYAAISVRNDMQSVDKALRIIFGTKYQVILRNEDHAEAHQRYDSSQTVDYISEEDTRFSHPPVILHQRQSARLSDERKSTRQSTSSVSTSSLNKLRERLSAFPKSSICAEDFVRVSARPQLNSVSEVTEIEEKQNCSLSTVKLWPSVCHSNREDNILQGEGYCIQKSKNNENPDVENIIDLLAQEALQYTCLEETKKSQNENRDAVNIIPNVCKSAKFRKCIRTFINDSTDESSSAFVVNTPAINLEVKENTNISASITAKGRVFKSISLKRKNLLSKTDECSLIKPKSLAEINNSTKNKSIESIFLRPLTNVKNKFDFNYIEVVECLDAVVLKICEDFENLNENRNKTLNKVFTKVDCEKVPFEEEVTGSTKTSNNKTQNKPNRKANIAKIKIKFPNPKTQMDIRKTKTKIKNSDVIMPIINNKGVQNESINECNTDILRMITGDLGNKNKRKRKLYSSKDDNIINAKIGNHVSETEEDNSIFSQLKNINTTPKLTATDKELKINDGSVRQLRNRKYCLSKTDKNDVFDNLKKTIDGETNITLIDTNVFSKNAAVYNFTSGSDDDNFKTRVNTVSNIKKRTNRKTVRPRVTKKENPDSKYSPSREIDTNTIKRQNSKRQRGKKQLTKKTRKRSRDIVDERMRKAPSDVSNTSLSIIEPGPNAFSVEPEPQHKKPRMISISNGKECEIFTITDNKKTRNAKNKNLCSKNKKYLTYNELVTSAKAEEREVSPLPGLVIETVQKFTDHDDSVTVTMIENFKDIYKSDQLSEVTNTRPDSKINSKLNKNENNTSQRLSMESDTTNSNNNQIVIVLDKFDLHEATLSTIGKSPITAHGISNEKPPDVHELNKKIPRRSLHTEELSDNVLNYYNLLSTEMNESLNNSNSKNDSQYEVAKNNNMPRPELLIGNLTPTVSITRLSTSEMNKYLAPSTKAINTTQTSNDIVTRQKTRNRLKINSSSGNSNTDKDEISNKPSPPNVRVSTISPINLDCELNIKNKKDDSTVCRLDYLNAKSKYNLRRYSSSKTKNSSTPDSKVQGSKGSNHKSMAIVSDEIRTANFNTRNKNINKVFENAYLTEATGSSVKDWLLDNDRREEIDKDEQLESVFEIVSIISEKLNTTLEEILCNTRESLINMFVENRARLEQLQSERENMSKEIRKDIISTFMNVVEEKFADMNRRSREQDEIIQSEMAEKAKTILRNYIRQKRDMVELLKEDVNAAMDRIYSGNKSS